MKLTGLIFWWSGPVATIPLGWALCDGTNGTPNIRNRFVGGVGPGSNFSVDEQIGNPNHRHSFVSDGHFHTIGPGTDLDIGALDNVHTTANAVTGNTNPTQGLPPFHALLPIVIL